MIQIEGVTPEQKRMLDHMMSIDSFEEFSDWYHALSESKRQQADLLKTLLLYEYTDDIADFAEARSVIEMVK